MCVRVCVHSLVLAGVPEDGGQQADQTDEAEPGEEGLEEHSSWAAPPPPPPTPPIREFSPAPLTL